MRKIVYYVAISTDGYIAGPDGDISKFVANGKGVQKYLKDLKGFDTVIMGKNTYELGYSFGMKPGENPYPHMRCYVVSDSLKLEQGPSDINIVSLDLNFIRQLKDQEGTDIYLCGGGMLAGWLLENDMVDSLKLKINPILLKTGIRLFGSSKKRFHLDLKNCQIFNDIQVNEYDIQY
ncbi:MAG: dihydrofolate reductase [Saprospiraceae bacterium]|nr:dihydrofolate reductase [Saprospiraceae bacterium]